MEQKTLEQGNGIMAKTTKTTKTTKTGATKITSTPAEKAVRLAERALKNAKESRYRPQGQGVAHCQRGSCWSWGDIKKSQTDFEKGHYTSDPSAKTPTAKVTTKTTTAKTAAKRPAGNGNHLVSPEVRIAQSSHCGKQEGLVDAKKAAEAAAANKGTKNKPAATKVTETAVAPKKKKVTAVTVAPKKGKTKPAAPAKKKRTVA